MEDKKVEVTLELLNALMGYLGTRPYGEVYTLIQSIQQQAAPQLKDQPQAQAPAQDEGQ